MVVPAGRGTGEPAAIEAATVAMHRGLDRDHARVRAERLDRRRHAGHEPATADRHDDLRDLVDLLAQLEPERALAGHDRAVVERVHDHAAARLGLGIHARERLGRIGRLDDRPCRRRRAWPPPWPGSPSSASSRARSVPSSRPASATAAA